MNAMDDIMHTDELPPIALPPDVSDEASAAFREWLRQVRNLDEFGEEPGWLDDRTFHTYS